ncbi:hypothetical protein DPMN_067371 [Dreissena polymorpha]|uniref:Uncharacterized protein n=1 Tax=Dreissena polymorpha TaxID=45954 RepID=A0A9D3YZK4_DREPO|nr:hypothetical protein DPMN_067371 [Dreissena polymorpha]
MFALRPRSVKLLRLILLVENRRVIGVAVSNVKVADEKMHFEEDRLLRIRSSWRKSLDRGCLQDTLCGGLVWKKVEMRLTLWHDYRAVIGAFSCI